MKAEEVKIFGVVGAGQMGNGIAQVASASGLQVIMSDIAEEFLQKGLKTITANLDRSVEKGRMKGEDKDAVRKRIRTTTSMKDFAEADFVVEAAPENQELKLKIFQELDKICRPGVTLATNTSSIPITRVASATKRPQLVIGMHFMNPVPVMKLVEIINGLATARETFELTRDLARKLDKIPVQSRDFPGFIANRILIPMINEAIFALYEGIGTAEDIDNVMKFGMNHPMGPLALADLIGLDICLAVMNVLYEGFADSKYRPCPLLKQYVDAGYLGRKVGRGFYDYRKK
jgi:3-hydroxybutyryl-CoA dehydrogenase